MKLYIYENETMEHKATIIGRDNTECEEIANERFSDTDYYGWTYTPAFEIEGGLIENENAEIINE